MQFIINTLREHAGIDDSVDVDICEAYFYNCAIMHSKTARRRAGRQRKPERTASRSNPSEADSCGVFIFDEERVKNARTAMLSDVFLEEIADTFRVLSHPTRVKILRALAQEELCVCDLAQILGLSKSATSHQLRSLRSMRLVRSRTSGKFVYYRLWDQFVPALLEDCVRHIKKQEAVS